MSVYSPVATEVSPDRTEIKLRERHEPQPNVVKRYARKIYNPLGFKKAYNFVFSFICAGALLGLCLYNTLAVDVNGYWIKSAAPGEEFWFRKPRYNIVSRPCPETLTKLCKISLAD